MTPKEKADELISSFENLVQYDKISEEPIISKQIQSALIVVEELLSVLFQHHEIDYWKEVQSELEALR